MADAAAERRAHKRFAVPCCSEIADLNRDQTIKGKALNLSDGGLLMAMPIEAVPPRDSVVRVNFSLPRSTPNTYLLEDVACKAKVIRHEPMKDASLAGVALKFTEPISLMIEV